MCWVLWDVDVLDAADVDVDVLDAADDVLGAGGC